MADKAMFRIVIAGTQQAIFDEITRTDRPLGAIYNAVLHTDGLRPGGRFQMRTGTGRHVIVDGDVVECDPPRRFVHTHRFTQHDDPACRVVYDLKPVEGGIEVTMTVEGIPTGTKTAKSMMQGGPFILANLKAIVERGRLPIGTRMMYFMMDNMEFVLPARTKSENWPLEKKS